MNFKTRTISYKQEIIDGVDIKKGMNVILFSSPEIFRTIEFRVKGSIINLDFERYNLTTIRITSDVDIKNVSISSYSI